MLWASDLHPLIHELLLPKSCLSSWEIFPTSCASTFFFFPSSHSTPPASQPPCFLLSLFHKLMLYPNFYFAGSRLHLFLSARHSSCFLLFLTFCFWCCLVCLAQVLFTAIIFLSLSRFLSLSLLFIKFVRTEGACMWVCLCLSACLLLWIYPLELLSHTANTERLQGL